MTNKLSSDNDIKRIKKKYRMLYDYHTHTRYSHGFLYAHGKGTILENVKAAHECGLESIAISDHGPGHKFYGLSLDKLDNMRKDIRHAMQKFPDIKVYLSVEANIIDTPNGIDIPNEFVDKFDFLNAGYHYGLPHGNMTRNYIASHAGLPSGSMERLRSKNTELVLRALYENDIRILTHPGDKAPFDIDEIARACEQTNTLMEISSRHKHLTLEEIRISAKYAVKFVISSDAHRPAQVGSYEAGLLRAAAAGMDIGRIDNIKKV